MTVWGALAGGFAGTFVLTISLRGASELGFTRMDIPFLLGTAFTDDRTRARAMGYGLHFAFGLAFALVYYALFRAIHETGWAVGAAFGLVHGLFSGSALVNVLLPLVHPRMGTPFTDATEPPLLEPPGFLLENYGSRTALGNLIGHLMYGAVVGGFSAHLALWT